MKLSILSNEISFRHKTRNKLTLTVKLEFHANFFHYEFSEHKDHIPWVSPSHGQLLIRRILWGYGEPLLLIGLKVTYPPEIFHCVVDSGTSEWKTFEQTFTSYTSHLETYFNNLQANEEMLEYMRTYVDTESD